MAAAITTGHPTFTWRDETQGSGRHPSTRNGYLLGHYIGCKKPQKKIKKNFILMNILPQGQFLQ
jgi:hypothetical protein